MSEFSIASPFKEDIKLVTEIPGAFQKYKLAGSTSLMAEGGFGNMLFHHFKGRGYDIWYSNYLIKKDCTFVGGSQDAILELHIPFENDFKAWWEGLENSHLKSHQFELTYVPHVSTKAEFHGGMNYHTFDLHLSKEILTPFAKHCRRLDEFLNRVEKGRPANMLDLVQFLSFDMIRVIRNMLNFTFHESLARIYFDGLVNELLTLITIQVAGITDKPKFSPIELTHATEARKIILSNFEEYHTVEQLAKMVGTTEVKLQLVFKHVYGTTVGKFSREARIEASFKLLEQTDYPLRVICMMVGYDDPANFSVAFRRHFGYWPGQILKRKK